MPINASPEYIAAQRKYEAANTIQDKIICLQEMISTAPSHKGAEKLHKELNARMKKLKEQLYLDKKRKKGQRQSIAVRKESFQLAIIGYPNSGKSTLLNKLTDAEAKVADYPFTTIEPEIGMLEFEGAQLQVVEIPAIVENAAAEQAELMSVIMNADGLLLIYEDEKQKQVLMNELYKFNIHKPTMFIEKGNAPTKKEIFNFFDLIRVYTKEAGDEYSKERPLVLKRGTSVIEAAEHVHKDFVKKFNYARAWGPSRFQGQRVERDYILKDKDVLELHMEIPEY
jgi:hypothetical protein